MRILVHIDDDRYENGRDLDVTFWPVADMLHLASVWPEAISMLFKGE